MNKIGKQMIEGKGESIALAFFPVVAINQIFPRNYVAKIHIYCNT